MTHQDQLTEQCPTQRHFGPGPGGAGDPTGDPLITGQSLYLHSTQRGEKFFTWPSVEV